MGGKGSGSPSNVMAAHCAMSCGEIAEELGVSEQAISQTERKAMKKLRRNPLARRLFEMLISAQHEDAFIRSAARYTR